MKELSFFLVPLAFLCFLALVLRSRNDNEQQKVERIDTITRARITLDSLYWDTANRDRHHSAVDSMLQELEVK